MKVIILPVTRLQQNCSLLICEKTHQAVLVDPGGDIDLIESALKKEQVKLVCVLLTHLHADHCAAAPYFTEKYQVPIKGPNRNDIMWMDALKNQAQYHGIQYYPFSKMPEWLEKGDKITWGDEELEVLFCPGHTPGHIVFFHKRQRLLFVGDVLFDGSIGRTDLPGGSYDQLIHSIYNELLPLGEDVVFYPGHRGTSTLGEQQKSNRFLLSYRP